MDLHELGFFTVRWLHVLFGIVWIGMLYYFNFVQGEYFKEATADAKSDAVKKLAPRALWWFRWGAMFTFITGVIILAGMIKGQNIDLYIVFGAAMATLMFLNVWLIIWPNQKIVCGIVPGNAAEAGPKALLASRTNVLFSAPMLFGMLASQHMAGKGANLLATGASDTALTLSLLIIASLEANAIWGKLGPMQTVKGVIHMSIALTVVMVAIVNYL
jgi:uncharacterized membrane protein